LKEISVVFEVKVQVQVEQVLEMSWRERVCRLVL